MAFARELIGAGFSAGQAESIGGQYRALTALGSSLATAAPVTASITVVGSANGTLGVSLPSVEVGAEVWLFNNSGSTCPVYPDASTVAICVPGTGLGSAGTAFSLLTYKTAIFKRATATQWLVCVTV
jgi:hypothetical protein